METVWKALESIDVRALFLAAFNAGVIYSILRRSQADIRRLKRFKAWALGVLSKVKMLHESKYTNEDLGDDWKEEE